jgi:1,4-dihydroxy-2-naphthoate octaprenyltransferase
MGSWILASRPKTLPAAIVPVVTGGALAIADQQFALLPWGICLIFALLIQIGTNFANDYYDYVNGADGLDRIGPKRAVASGWISPECMRRAMFGVFSVALLVGSLLIFYGGSWLILVGILSVLCGIAYTGGPYPLGYNGLGDVFVFVFFGWVATVITFFVQSGSFAMTELNGEFIWPLLAGMVPGALATNLLVVNNVRDAPLDALAGKRTLVVRFGRLFGLMEFALMTLIAHGVPLLFAARLESPWVALPVLALPLSLTALWKLVRARNAQDYAGVLLQSALLLLSLGLLFCVGLMLSAPQGGTG